MDETLEPRLDRVQQRARAVGVVGLVLCLVGAATGPQQFFRSYLVAYLFWMGIALGCCALLMLHHLAGGNWGFVIRRPLEAGTRTLPLMALLALPFLFGLRHMYVWARPDQVAVDELLQHKSAYLNIPFFVLRTVCYFAIWLGLAFLLNKWSEEQDRTADPSLARRLEALSGPGLVLYGLTVTFASIDWVMSLEPHWSSTIYGMLFMVGQVLATLAFVVVVATLLAGYKPLSEAISTAHFHDLGNLTFAFVMLWAYLSVSQYIIIWSGNLPEEIRWYLSRLSAGWQGIALFLVLFHFAVPFLLLLSRDIKRRPGRLAALAVFILAIRMVDLYWLVAPAFEPTVLRVHWTDLVAPFGVGGVWVAVFVWQLKSRPLVPLHDTRRSALEHGVTHG